MVKMLRGNRGKGLERIESFSDSIFGFAITLLVLELLQIPRTEIGQNLFNSFSTHWQTFFAFLVGFCTILVCWINHHYLFRYMVQYDGRFLWINGALLLVVTFTPLPTALFSEFLLKENSTGLVLFGMTYFLIASVALLMWTYTYSNQFLDPTVDQWYYKSIIKLFRYGWIHTVVAFASCFYSNVVAMIMYAMLFAVFAFPQHFTLLLLKYGTKSNSLRDQEESTIPPANSR